MSSMLPAVEFVSSHTNPKRKRGNLLYKPEAQARDTQRHATIHSLASLDVARFELARLHESQCLRPEGAKTYQPGADRSDAPGAGNRRIPRPERAEQMANRIDELRVLFRPFRATNAPLDSIPRALPWADIWLPLWGGFPPLVHPT